MIVGLVALLAGCPHASDPPPPVPAVAPRLPMSVVSYTDSPSGLRMADVVVGTGAEVHAGDRIEVGYTGWVQGRDTPFDTSYGRNTPFIASIGVGQLIAGWDEGIVGMREGGRRQLVIPPALGYGDRGAPPVIPPSATLVFDVELLHVLPARTPPSAPPRCTEPMVQTLTGLQFCDLRVGTGESPLPGQIVRTEYTGWLADGTRFDSSYLRDEPLAFPVGEGRVIKGWDEGLSTMRVGGRRLMIIPPKLAYGAAGHPPVIPEDSTLTFEVELVGIATGL